MDWNDMGWNGMRSARITTRRWRRPCNVYVYSAFAAAVAVAGLSGRHIIPREAFLFLFVRSSAGRGRERLGSLLCTYSRGIGFELNEFYLTVDVLKMGRD